mgnify:CR=1 FL=1
MRVDYFVVGASQVAELNQHILRRIDMVLSFLPALNLDEQHHLHGPLVEDVKHRVIVWGCVHIVAEETSSYVAAIESDSSHVAQPALQLCVKLKHSIHTRNKVAGGNGVATVVLEEIWHFSMLNICWLDLKKAVLR